MEVALPEVEQLINEVRLLKAEIAEIKGVLTPSQRWFDLKSACELKGVNYNTVVSTHRYQPNKGIADAVICGRKRWSRETVMDWLDEIDSDLDEKAA
jgi:hypothetical protein